MNLQVGRAVLCAPTRRAGWEDLPSLQVGAHGVTRPTVSRFRGSKRKFVRGILTPANFLRRGGIVRRLPVRASGFGLLSDFDIRISDFLP